MFELWPELTIVMRPRAGLGHQIQSSVLGDLVQTLLQSDGLSSPTPISLMLKMKHSFRFLIENGHTAGERSHGLA